MSQLHFGKVRSLLWPIHRYELKKFIPMFLMFFCVSFNYSLLRCIKDAILIDASALPGAEILPYIKFWGVTPLAILFMVCYTKLSNIVSRQAVFYISVLFFITFFLTFALFLYPNSHLLHPATLNIPFLPKGLIEVIRLWSFSLFYIFSELWGSVALSLLFWQFANQITKVEESKRFYTLFGLGANLALECSGQSIGFFNRLEKVYACNPEEAMAFSLNGLTTLFLISALSTLLIYWWINKYVMTDARFYDPNVQAQSRRKKLKMGLADSIKMLLRSKYLICITLLVVCYGVGINLVEVTWKSYLKVQYPTSIEYLEFMGKFSRITAWATIFMMLFVSGNVLRKFGWTIAALVTPVVLLVFGLGFFNLIIFESKFEFILQLLGISATALAVLFGSVQNVISKASKYSLFDPTKEMLYIPLDEEAQVKGKAAIDVVGARLGKAGGSVIQQVLFSFGTLAALLLYVEMIFVCIMAIWIFAAVKLGKDFNKSNHECPQVKARCASS